MNEYTKQEELVLLTIVYRLIYNGRLITLQTGRKQMNNKDMNAARWRRLLLCIAAGCLCMTGCTPARMEYTVMGATNEASRVTQEAYTPAFATDFAAVEEPQEDSTAAAAESEEGGTEEAASEGSTEQKAESPYRVLVNNVNFCEKPNGRVMRIITSGSRIELLSDVKKGWYKVRYRGTEGYIQEGNFKEDLERLEAERKKTEAEEQRRLKEEEEKRKAEEEERKKREEEERKKKEEEEKKKAEEEALKKAEEEKKRKEEEERKKKEEEEKKKAAEEARKKEEEEKKRQQEEERARAMAAGEVTRIMATTVNLRDPDNTDELLGIVPAGDTVIVYEALDDGWYLVESRGTRGVIKGGYFTEDDP